MAIAYTGTTWNGLAGEVASFDITVPVAGVAQNALLVLTTACSSGSVDLSTITDDRGNTWNIHTNFNDAGSTNSISLASTYVTTALVSGDLIHVTLVSGLNSSYVLAAFTGIASSSYFDKSSTLLEPFDPWYESGFTATTSQADELLIGMASTRATSATATPDAPWNTIHNGNFNSQWKHIFTYQIVAATGTYQNRGTYTTDETSIALIGTFKAAAAPPPSAKIAWIRA